MIVAWMPFMLLVVHYVADFLLQSDWMAQNKSKRWDALLTHTSIYSICFIFWGWRFVLITFVLHTITDAVTSRINTRLWQRKQVHWFFASVGFDQLIHFYTLAATYWWLAERNYL